jgi:hypothetical protein
MVPDVQLDTHKVERHIELIEKVIQVKQTPELTDSAISMYINHLGLDKQYYVSTNHDPYLISGNFNYDEIMDTAILLQDKVSGKEGLFIKHGRLDEQFIFGGGEEVLSQKFDDFSWVGIFQKIGRGTKVFSNIDEETGEILIEDLPDSLKITLPSDGIYVHASESCGGGIIYWDYAEYKWIQQE